MYNQLKEDKKDVWILVTGGQVEKGPNKTNPTEAQVMQQYLVKAGIPSVKIILEKNSLTTVHNMENSKPLLVRHKFSKVYLVTTDFHVPRSLLIFKNLIPAFADKVEGHPTPSGLDEEGQNKELAVESEMMERYKTRFPKWNFDV